MHWLLLWALIYLPLIGVCLQFWSATLYQWDMVGHYLAATHFSESVWPDFVGWNSHLFGGYPQGHFYPSLFHWLIAGTQKILPGEGAFRLWVVLSTLLIPWSVGRLGRALYPDSLSKQAGLLVGILFLYFVPKGPSGGDLYSTFRIGLVNQNWALIPFFLFLAEEWRESPPRGRILRAGFFLGVTLLSHAIVGLTALLLLGVRFSWRRTPWVVLVAGAVSAAWSVPFLLYRSFATGLGIRFLAGWNLIADSDVAMPLFTLSVTALAAVLWWGRKGYRLADPWLRAFGILAGVGLVAEFIHLTKLFDLQHGLAIHFYRLQGPILFAAFAPAFVAVSTQLHRRLVRILGLLLLAIAWFSAFHCVSSKRTEYNLETGFTGQSRVLVYQGLDTLLSQAAPHHLADSLQRDGVKTVNGLFAESSKQSRYYLSTLNELFTRPMVWGVELMPFSPRLARKHMRILGVDAIVSNEKMNSSVRAHLPVLEWQEDVRAEVRFADHLKIESFHAYVLKNELVEVLPSIRNVRDEDWKDSVYDWWMSESEAPWLIRGQMDAVPDPTAPLPSIAPRFERIGPGEIRIRFDSVEPRWLLIKEAFFPNWRAYDEEGRRLPVFEAAPSLMAIHGRGSITLKFELTPLERLAQGLSLLFLLGLPGFWILTLLRRHWNTRLSGMILLLLFQSACSPSEPRRQLEVDWLVSGDYHACKKREGEVRCWGVNHYGQYGDGTRISDPHSVRGSWPTNATGGAAGLSFTCLHSANEIHCSGRIGPIRSSTPRLLYRSQHSIAALVGRHRALCVQFKSPGPPPVCFGHLDHEALDSLILPDRTNLLALGPDRLCASDGTAIRCKRPFKKFESLRIESKWKGRVLDLAVGRDRVCALIESKADRFIRCWGGPQEHWPSPPEDEWRKVVCGDGHACGLTKQGEIWCWGDNSKLQSAPLAKFGMVQVLESPKVVPLIRKAQALQTGALHTCALIGRYYSCFGVLGNGIEGL